MVEDTLVQSTLPNGEEELVEILVQGLKGENVRKAGSDVLKGDKIVEKGSEADAGTIGELIGVRETNVRFRSIYTVQILQDCCIWLLKVRVHRRPTISILSTGNELYDISSPSPSVTSTPDSNRPSLHAILRSLPYPSSLILDLGIVPDAMSDHLSIIENGLSSSDIIITTGGTSMGEGDLLKPAIEQLGGEWIFGRVEMKPGKPTGFAKFTNWKGEGWDKFVWALPGNPGKSKNQFGSKNLSKKERVWFFSSWKLTASAMTTFELFVLPCILILSGHPPSSLPSLSGSTSIKILSSLQKDSDRPEFHRVRVTESEGGELVGKSTGGQRSSRVGSWKGSNGIVMVEKGQGKVESGEVVKVRLVGGRIRFEKVWNQLLYLKCMVNTYTLVIYAYFRYDQLEALVIQSLSWKV
jgi:gephyrin